MGVTTDGNPFGVAEGIFCSLPVRCTVGGDWNYDEGFSLTDDVRRHLEASVAVSRSFPLMLRLFGVELL